MTVDPAPLAERRETVDRSDLKMRATDSRSLEDRADVDPELIEEFDL